MSIVNGNLSLLPLALPILVLLSARAPAQVRGTYTPGSTLTSGGTISGTGFSYNNQFWATSSSQLKGPQGNTLVQGSLSLKLDNSTISYVPKFKLLHANIELSVDIVFSNGTLAAFDPLSGQSVHASAAGLADTVFVPISLGWHLKRADILTAYNVSAPTGRYIPGADNNLSTGYWTNSWQAGTTLYLSKSKATQLSIFNNYSWNTLQRGTPIRPGQDDSVDYSLTQSISLTKSGKWPLQFGPAGYGQWQTTQATGQNPLRAGLLYGVNAAGLTLDLSTPLKSLAIGASALWEYHARNTYQGRTLTINANLNF